MNRIAIISSIMVAVGCFLPWMPTQKMGFENKEWVAVLSFSVIVALLAIYNEMRKPGRVQWLYTLIALLFCGVLTVEVKMIINANHQFSLQGVGTGLYLVAIGTFGLLLSGLYYFPKTSIAAVVVAAGLALFMFNKINAENPDQADVKADVTVDAASFINSFEKDSASASKQYIDKTVLVTGKIKSLDTSGVISLGEPGQMSSVQCTMDKRHKIDYNSLKEGSEVSIKGRCNGYETQDLLGTDVKMNFCVLNKNNK